MDKKEAEQEALRRAKNAQNAAGKNTGMSGRDLFQYNPEWFEDEDDGDGTDDWDLNKYRREKEEEDLAREELRIAQLNVGDGEHQGDAEGSGGGQGLHKGID